MILIRIKKNIRPFIIFCFIGLLNTIIHLSILYILVEYFSIYYVFSSFIGFIFAVTNSFVLNTVFTFKQRIKYKTKSRYSKFFIVSSIAAIINLSLLFIITEFFGIWYIFSQIIATFFSLTINFSGNKIWTVNNE